MTVSCCIPRSRAPASSPRPFRPADGKRSVACGSTNFRRPARGRSCRASRSGGLSLHDVAHVTDRLRYEKAVQPVRRAVRHASAESFARTGTAGSLHSRRLAGVPERHTGKAHRQTLDGSAVPMSVRCPDVVVWRCLVLPPTGFGFLLTCAGAGCVEVSGGIRERRPARCPPDASGDTKEAVRQRRTASFVVWRWVADRHGHGALYADASRCPMRRRFLFDVSDSVSPFGWRRMETLCVGTRSEQTEAPNRPKYRIGAKAGRRRCRFTVLRPSGRL